MRLYATTLLLILLWSWNEYIRYFRLFPSGSGRPRVLGLILVPRLHRIGFIVSGVAFISFILGVALGVYPVVALGGALVSYFFYFGQILNHDEIKQKTHTIPLIFFTLLYFQVFLPQDSAIAVLSIKLIVAQVYLSSVFQKLRTSSWKWLNGVSLQAYFMDAYLKGGSQFPWKLAQNLTICRIVSIGTIAFELSVIAAIFLPEFAYVFVGFGLLFHLGIYLTMRINYLKFFCPAYWIFMVGCF